MTFNPIRSAVRVLDAQERADAESLVRRRSPEQADQILDMLGLGAPAPVKIKQTAPQKRRHSHCPKGHEFTPESTYVRPDDGRRRCRTCEKTRRNLKKESS